MQTKVRLQNALREVKTGQIKSMFRSDRVQEIRELMDLPIVSECAAECNLTVFAFACLQRRRIAIEHTLGCKASCKEM
jgi:hypothetical protein